MLYVVVCVVKGEAGDFNNRLRQDIWGKFKARSSKLPAHFTIKAPFKYEGDVTELENVLEVFCQKECAQPFKIEGYDHFDNRVVYMKVNMSEESKAVHDRLIETVSKVPYMFFDKQDGKDKTFHITVASKKLQDLYHKIWEYVGQYPCEFDCFFDNISIYKWEEDTWKLYKEFRLSYVK